MVVSPDLWPICSFRTSKPPKEARSAQPWSSLLSMTSSTGGKGRVWSGDGVFKETDETNGQIWKHMENIRLHLLALPKYSHDLSCHWKWMEMGWDMNRYELSNNSDVWRQDTPGAPCANGLSTAACAGKALRASWQPNSWPVNARACTPLCCLDCWTECLTLLLFYKVPLHSSRMDTTWHQFTPPNP